MFSTELYFVTAQLTRRRILLLPAHSLVNNLAYTETFQKLTKWTFFTWILQTSLQVAAYISITLIYFVIT
jgi:hypothetical protein